MKKRLLAFLVTVFTLICMALPAYAEEAEVTPPSPRRLDVQLVQVSLRDSGNAVHQNNLYDGSSFFLNMTWNATETIHTGDYFDILVPEQVDMSSDKLEQTFPIIDSDTGDVIGEGTLHPNGNEGGKISVVFNEQANNRSNLSGNIYLWVPFNKDHIQLNQKNVITLTIKEKLPDLDGIRTYVYEKFESEVPNDAPELTLPELKVTRFVDEQGNDLHELVKDFVEKLDIDGYVFKETTETTDIRTHVYTKVETEVPNDAPTVEVPELKITRFVDTNGVELKNIVEGFVEKDSNIVYENEQYDYVNTTEEDGIRTHIYKKHVNEEVPNSNTTTPTDNTTTENKVISDHIVPTGDNMNNTLKLFALSMLGLGFTLLYKKKTTE